MSKTSHVSQTHAGKLDSVGVAEFISDFPSVDRSCRCGWWLMNCSCCFVYISSPVVFLQLALFLFRLVSLVAVSTPRRPSRSAKHKLQKIIRGSEN